MTAAGRPIPRRVRVFLAEKGITVPIEPVDLGALAQKSAAYTAINPLQRVPALVLDDGTVICRNRSRSAAISRRCNPEPPLFGRGAHEIALIEMWKRRLELHLLLPVSHVFRNTPSGDEGDGGAAGAGLGRGQQAARSRTSCGCSTAS